MQQFVAWPQTDAAVVAANAMAVAKRETGDDDR